MGIFAWIVVGAIAGFVATVLMGDRAGVIVTVILGILGGLLGGWVAVNLFHYGDVTGINLYSIVIAVAGALVVIATWHVLTARHYGWSRS